MPPQVSPHLTQKERQCETCGALFKPERKSRGRFCSLLCASKRNILDIGDTLARCSIQRENGCLEWTGHTDRAEYGRIASVLTQEVLVHRIAHEHRHGKIPRGLHVLHKCDNRKCFSDDHLYLGTNEDNVRDRMNRGRHKPLKGMANGMAKLTESQVIKIRADKRSTTVLGRKYGVGSSTISLIKRGVGWKHI